jgi:hypothetical protein
MILRRRDLPGTARGQLTLGICFIAVGIITACIYAAYADTAGSIIDFGNNNASQTGALLLVMCHLS